MSFSTPKSICKSLHTPYSIDDQSIAEDAVLVDSQKKCKNETFSVIFGILFIIPFFRRHPVFRFSCLGTARTLQYSAVAEMETIE